MCAPSKGTLVITVVSDQPTYSAIHRLRDHCAASCGENTPCFSWA